MHINNTQLFCLPLRFKYKIKAHPISTSVPKLPTHKPWKGGGKKKI